MTAARVPRGLQQPFKALRGKITANIVDGARGIGPEPALRVAGAQATTPDMHGDITGPTTWFVLALRHSAMAWRGDIDHAACDTSGDHIAEPSRPRVSRLARQRCAAIATGAAIKDKAQTKGRGEGTMVRRGTCDATLTSA